MSLPKDYERQVLKKLISVDAARECELCGKNNWSVVDQAVAANVTDLSGSVHLPQPHIPCAAVICNNCGNLRLHALGALGIDISKEKTEKND